MSSAYFVALLTTLQCPLQCSHCIYECSPHVTERMTIGQLKRYVDQIASVGIRLINLSGGEPFLLGRDLDEIVEYSTKKGIDVHVITAAHWATSKQAAVERLRRLADRGLRFLILSCDDYHQEFVPLQSVKNAIEAAVELDISFHINVIYTSQSKITKGFLEEELKELLEDNRHYIPAKKWHSIIRNLAERKETQNFVQLVSKLTPAEQGTLGRLRTYEIRPEPACEGSGRCVLGEEEKVPDFPIGHKTLNECNSLQSLLIRPDGSVKGCIGHIHAQSEPELHLGSLETEGLDVILDRAQTNPVLKCLQWGGPSVIAEYLMENEPSLKLKDRYRLSCDLCSDLFGNSAIRPLLFKHADGLYERLKNAHKQPKHQFMVEDKEKSLTALAAVE
jgi:MoaA/NifB/PqqE/SkfB family radical SAM enzyme